MIPPRVPRTSKEKSKTLTEEVKADQIENILKTSESSTSVSSTERGLFGNKMTTKSNVNKASFWIKGLKSQSAEKGVDGGSDRRRNGATALVSFAVAFLKTQSAQKPQFLPIPPRRLALESLALAPGNAALFHEIAKLVNFHQILYIRRNIADSNH
ncbi:unnamed protein product [Oikopleura dioica]|uniref:Uncharacterized protein n=1 Tax=Oikopleura dioica TaxID=34765 RepID=E4XDT8_OIKDI|nr:unnamed protein product [Oikopleura dioica]